MLNGERFYDYLKLIHSKFGRCVLFLDKATQHQSSEEVLSYFEAREDPWCPYESPLHLRSSCMTLRNHSTPIRVSICVTKDS